MTLQGAIQELHAMRSDENFTFYYKPVIDKVIETLEMDAQEVRYGRWIDPNDSIVSGICSICGWKSIYQESDIVGMNYCPNCGARMNSKE